MPRRQLMSDAQIDAAMQSESMRFNTTAPELARLAAQFQELAARNSRPTNYFFSGSAGFEGSGAGAGLPSPAEGVGAGCGAGEGASGAGGVFPAPAPGGGVAGFFSPSAPGSVAGASGTLAAGEATPSSGVVPGAGVAGAGVAAGGGPAQSSAFPTLLLPPWRTVSHPRTAETAKKVIPRFRVIVWSTLVVWAPKRFSVIPPPNAAPRPSFFGRCISTSRMSSRQIRTSMTSRILMTMDITGA